jgi:hypothetical protein
MAPGEYVVFKKAASWEPQQPPWTKNSLGGGVIEARDQGGSCGAGSFEGLVPFREICSEEQEPGRSFELALPVHKLFRRRISP